jgi:hypothetical protein
MDAESQWADDWGQSEGQHRETERLGPRAALIVIAALSLGLWSAIGLAATSVFRHLW